MKTQTSNTLHNAIIEAGSKDRPTMLAPVQIILTWIDNDIYSIVDAYPNACEMWKAIERLKQGESISVQDLETNLYWEFEKFTSQDGESLESYYLRFYKMMNELIRNQCVITNHQVNVQFLLQLQPEWQRFVTLVKQSQKLKNVSYHKLYDILKQHQNKVNEIRAKRIARVANPLVLVSQQQPDKEIDKLMALISLSFKKIYKPTNNNLRTSSNTSRANQDNSIRINRSAEYENQRIGNVVRARETLGSTVVQKSGIQCYNCKEFRHVARGCQKPKGQRMHLITRKICYCELEAHYIYMIQLQEASLDATDSGPIFDDEPLQKVSNDDHYNVFSIESAHPKQSKYIPDTYPIEQDAHNMIIDSLDISYDREEIDQNDDDNDLANERTVKFRNDQIAPILGYRDLVQGAIIIKRVYYVEGLNHNLFSVGQFYDADLEVAFRKSTCYIRDLKGNDL
nr:integrase, catalytic region, zinc finger, CCHC-type, peptidase aspartic, catalytic [Tanacetum cinerariifolium]